LDRAELSDKRGIQRNIAILKEVGLLIGPDAQQMRTYLYSLIDWSQARAVLDVGCGNGYDLRQLQEFVPSSARLVGIDSSPAKIAEAIASVAGMDRFHFASFNAEENLPFNNGEFDIVLSSNVLECISARQSFLKEVHRILQPGGQILLSHFDWDSQIVDGNDKTLVRRILHAWADWQQPWMVACDGWMGRRLRRTINSLNLFQGKVSAYVLTNTSYEKGNYGWERMQDFGEMVKHGIIEATAYDAFLSDLAALAASDEYFYSITMYAYSGRKV
jgi:ubiquinone/menaquinone biosynthesis C-methylase UbiE